MRYVIYGYSEVFTDNHLEYTLNQTVHGSSPCAPTNHFNGLDK